LVSTYTGTLNTAENRKNPDSQTGRAKLNIDKPNKDHNMDGKAIRIKTPSRKPAMADIRNIFMHVLEMVLPEPALKRYVKYNREIIF